MIFGPDNAHLDYCLTCNRKITQAEWEWNNGVCEFCPRLTEIAPAFWKVINHLALRGDEQAQETMVKYG